MRSVMLVDDDYPVLELLQETIPWEALGLRVAGCFENGAAALEASLRAMPDILITDIGMPKMDGLELISLMKKRNANLRVLILSCHSEFEYAKRALQLQVHDYLIKDTLTPEDLIPLLEKFTASLNEEQRQDVEKDRLRLAADRSRDVMRERWMQATLNQPILQKVRWIEELESFGLPAAGRNILPTAGFIDGLRQARQRFASDDILRFAVSNVIDEVLEGSADHALSFPYESGKWFVLHSFRPTLTVNGYDETRRLLEHVQDALYRCLKISMSFMIGGLCRSHDDVKRSAQALLASEEQRFYRSMGEMMSVQSSYPTEAADLFAYYDEASEAFLEQVMKHDSESIHAKTAEWIRFIRSKRYPPGLVKEWFLKLLLDLRLKQHALCAFRSSLSAESLHKDAAEIESLPELQDWLVGQLLMLAAAIQKNRYASHRKEVQEACEYVAAHLDQRISLEEVAGSLHLNASYFSRLFKKETGETFIEYVIRTKIDRAKQLLDQTAYPVVKITEMLGYDNQSYFIKLFKGCTGMTPMDYRNRSLRSG
ncbi:response regulator [Paenibacillus turpanensis]|uniref:response regulator n=1 Tax=Paenibacillus turpanensis TaxID=2689078 RepID=UPI00140C2815|nr:response regulator [Paenibacillus turpanensis]